MKTATALVFAAVVLTGCTASGDTTGTLGVSVAGAASQEPVPPGDLAAIDGPVEQEPQGMGAGSSPISPDIQPAFCQDQVAFMQGTERQNATTHERVVAPDGSTTIDVTVDKGSEGLKTFKCRLDASSRFVDVVAATSDEAS